MDKQLSRVATSDTSLKGGVAYGHISIVDFNDSFWNVHSSCD